MKAAPVIATLYQILGSGGTGKYLHNYVNKTSNQKQYLHLKLIFIQFRHPHGLTYMGLNLHLTFCKFFKILVLNSETGTTNM
jgi:hypothetical protein